MKKERLTWRPGGQPSPETKFEKAQRLLRYHRQHAFDTRTGDAHVRAIVMIKKTAIWKAEMERTRQEREHVRSERLLRMYA